MFFNFSPYRSGHYFEQYCNDTIVSSHRLAPFYNNKTCMQRTIVKQQTSNQFPFQCAPRRSLPIYQVKTNGQHNGLCETYISYFPFLSTKQARTMPGRERPVKEKKAQTEREIGQLWVGNVIK